MKRCHSKSVLPSFAGDSQVIEPDLRKTTTTAVKYHISFHSGSPVRQTQHKATQNNAKADTRDRFQNIIMLALFTNYARGIYLSAQCANFNPARSLQPMYQHGRG